MDGSRGLPSTDVSPAWSPNMAKARYKSFAKGGKGLNLAKKLRGIYELAGYSPMPVDEFTSAIRSGRHPPGTFAFAVVDASDSKPRFPGTVIIYPEGQVFFEGEEDELRGIL